MSGERPPHALHRRDLLIGAGALALLPIPIACAQESGKERAAARAPGRLIAGDACPVTPRQTEGPFYFDPRLVRQDIREGRPGVPLRLRLQIVDAADCAPSRQARVDIWHCDAGGTYSGYDRERSSGETYLRGTQVADAGGIAEFHTLYPGWYQGRAPHIHLKAWLADGRELTSQLYFPDALSDQLYAQGPYTRGGGGRLRNEEDGIFRRLDGRAPIATMARAAQGYDGAIVIAIS
jgi:protocatechuate 3,4-dioxygenase beta subunit